MNLILNLIAILAVVVAVAGVVGFGAQAYATHGRKAWPVAASALVYALAFLLEPPKPMGIFRGSSLDFPDAVRWVAFGVFMFLAFREYRRTIKDKGC